MAPRPEIPDPAEMIDRDRVMLVSDEVQQLPPRQRTVVILYYGCGLSIGEIARRERIAKETVRDALARAHARLRRSRELTRQLGYQLVGKRSLSPVAARQQSDRREHDSPRQMTPSASAS